MQYTGIVRRIDDLGRIVIPKEIRRRMHIREGEPLELVMINDEEGQVIGFKKYDYIDPFDKAYLTSFSSVLRNKGIDHAFYSNAGRFICGNLNEYTDKMEGIHSREDFIINGKIYGKPILAQGDIVGYIIFSGEENTDYISDFVAVISRIYTVARPHEY